MKNEFLNYITKNNFVESNRKILLAVSGGIDSMVMLHLFQECGFSIGVAHANFQLRDIESEGDEKFVEEVCKRNSIPFFKKRFETESHAKGNHLSIQMAARELRYQWFNERLTEKQFDFIATAHHLNDSIETVLLNLVRGSGLEGLDGITSKNGKIIRPMLFATRQQIENYAKENKIQWREDRSNATDDYSRNFIRHQVYPLLKELNPSLEKTFDESINKISGAVELMEIGIDQWKEGFERKKENQILLDKKGLESFKNSESVLWTLIKSYGFNFDQCCQIITSLHGQSGKLFTSSQFELVIDRDHLIISKIQIGLSETLIESGQAEASLGRFKLKIEKKENIDFKDDPSIAFLDASKLKFPLYWRKWKPGDSFHPLGMNHKKKLSDFLIDQKISIADKESITVLESANEIVWVVGQRIDERYKVINSTEATVVCRLSTVD
jgi:tRNA(Ile)-lysidine synthase